MSYALSIELQFKIIEAVTCRVRCKEESRFAYRQFSVNSLAANPVAK